MQDTNQAAAPASWLGHKLINKAAADDMGAAVLPSDKSLAGRVWLALVDDDGDPLYVAGIVVGVTFLAAEVRYSLAFPVAPQPREGETMYAVVDNIDSSLVLSDLPEDETVFDAVLTEDAAVLIPREPLVALPAPVLDSANPLALAALQGELAERVAALQSALATDADPLQTLGVVREVLDLTNQVRAGKPFPELDPTEWPGYAEVLRDESKAVYWQDRLDSFFQGRIVGLRNALRALGWDGPQWGTLAKAGIIANFDFWQVGAGKNIVGMTVNGIRDDLRMNVDELAAAIDATAAVPEPAAPAIPTVGTLTGAELGQFPADEDGKRQLREAAKAFFTTNLLGSKVFNASLNSDIAFTTNGMKKMLSFSRDPRKLKLVPALPKILSSGVRTNTLPLRADESPRVVGVHVLKAGVELESATLTVRVIVKERDDGSFFYDHSVNREDLGRSAEVLDSVDSTGLSLTARHPAEPSAGQVLMDSVGESGELFNLFIEGEAPEVVEDDAPAAHSDQFGTYRAFIVKELAEGRAIPAGMLEIIRMDTRLNDGEAEQLEALAAAPAPEPTPQEKRSMDTLIKIAADTLAQLRRIDVYRVLEAAGDQRAELATYIATGRADLVREVTDVMAEEWPDLGWTLAAPAVVERTEGGDGELLVPNKDGAQKELVVPPVPKDEDTSNQGQSPERTADMAFLNGVISQAVDMWDDELADKIESLGATYENDAEMVDLWGRAIAAYTDFMVAAA